MTRIDWENITNYIDSVGTTDTVFPFAKTQSSVKVTTSGANDNIIYTIGGQSGTLSPGQSVTVTGTISSMTLRSASGRQPFQVWATEAGTEKDETDTSYQGQIDGLTTQLVQSASKTSRWIDVKQDYGAIGDGNSHPAYPTYATLSALQTKYPTLTNTFLTGQGIDTTTGWKTLELDWCAIQSAFNSFGLYSGGNVYFPDGIYRINQAIYVTQNFLLIRGNKNSSQIYNAGTKSAFIFKGAVQFTIERLQIKGNGNGNSFGAGATCLHGIEMNGATDWTINECYILGHGGHGIYCYNNGWNTVINKTLISGNVLDGVNALPQDSTHSSNGNQMNITNSSIYLNGGHGVRWNSTVLVATGNDIAENKGYGIYIDVTQNIRDARDIYITGNTIEENLPGQIKIDCPNYLYHFDTGVIEGNWFSTSQNGTGAGRSFIELNGTLEDIYKLHVGKNWYGTPPSGITPFYYVNATGLKRDCRIQVSSALKSYFNLSGWGGKDLSASSLCIQGLFNQKGVPWSSNYRSDNFISNPTKQAIFALPFKEGDAIIDIKQYIETDATAYTVRLQLAYSYMNAPLSVGYRMDRTVTFSSGGNQLLDHSSPSYYNSFYIQEMESNYYVLTITGVTGGTYMYLYDPIFYIVR